MKEALNILPAGLLPAYKSGLDPAIRQVFESLQDSELSISTFSFYTSVSAVFSSRIEGEEIELDSYIRHRRFGASYQPDYTRKIDDLYDAYIFAQNHRLTAANLHQAHALLTRNILRESQQGLVRTGNMYVITKEGKIEYVAAAPQQLQGELDRLFADMDTLLKADLSLEEVLFFASLLHLVFVKIHPYEDGNGRSSRLLEKWFMAEKLGPKAWFVQSEKYYYTHHLTYYNNIRQLGLEYEELDYSRALPFLSMLPESVFFKG